MKLKKSLIIALILSIIGLVVWESYWRSQGYYPTIDNTEALWAIQRSKVEKASKDEVLLIGSSRTLFDIQLNEWEKLTGIRPIQLANGGSSPLPVFHDIVNTTDFAGNIIAGVTPGLFFSTLDPNKMSWKRPQSRIDHYHDQTIAQRLNHFLSLPLQKNLVFISESNNSDELNLKTLLEQIKIGERAGEQEPPFYHFRDMAEDRNVKMTIKTSTDTAFANTIKKYWKFGNDDPSPERKATMSYFIEDAKKFKERGGNLILLRCPSTGYFKDREAKFFTRNAFWDNLVKQTNVKSYHYDDYEKLRYFDCPEWSHLSAKDARYFTTELAKIMIADGVIKAEQN